MQKLEPISQTIKALLIMTFSVTFISAVVVSTNYPGRLQIKISPKEGLVLDIHRFDR